MLLKILAGIEKGIELTQKNMIMPSLNSAGWIGSIIVKPEPMVHVMHRIDVSPLAVAL